MSQRRVFEGLGDLCFDAISQECPEECPEVRVTEVEMDTDVEMDIDARVSEARTTAVEILGDQFEEDDAKLFLDDIDDGWLGDSVDEENAFIGCVLAPEQSDVSCVLDGHAKLELPGFREVPHPELADAGNGIERMKSEKNNNWSLRRADKLRHALGWDMSVAFGDLPLTKVDELLSNLFSRVQKLKGGDYPAESLMNMLGGYNRLLRRASDLRALTNPKAIPLGRDFDIKKHPAFTRTRLTLGAAIKKTAKDGTNKKRKKVNHLTETMEEAVLSDVDHQMFHNEGCQKRTAFYLLVRCGIRGGDELWQLQRYDLKVKTDKNGREYVQYMERASKNNAYTLERTKEEQFRRPYHSYEPDFVMTCKQYLRHMPPFEEGTTDSLFLGCIKNPASIVWFNRVIKVGKGTSSGWLKNMLKLVGLPEHLFSNKSGRATLITRLAAQGVPDHVGMMLSGHHTADGYGRYDRTKDLQQEAAALVTYNPRMDYNTALATVSKRFVKEDLVGTTENLKPLLYHVSGASSSNPLVPYADASKQIVSHSMAEAIPCIEVPARSQLEYIQPEASSSGSSLQVQAGRILQNLQNQVPKQIQDHPKDQTLKVHDPAKKLALWNRDYDGIDWEKAARDDPSLASALGGFGRSGPVAIGAGNSFANYQNCTIQINLPPTFNPGNFDWAKILDYNKENNIPEKK